MPLPLVLFAFALAADDACALPTGRNARPCGAKVGHCIEVEIDGQRAVSLSDADLRAKLTDQAGYKPVCWTLPAPTAGKIDVKVSSNAQTEGLGDLREGFEVVVTGLEGQVVPTRKGLRTDPTVRIGGVPMQTAVDVIDTDALPPGAYVVRVRVVGRNGYDDKSIYVKVARP